MNQHVPTYGLNDQLTIDDLRAYRAGQLTGASQHRVERILLENPFYADALDGLDALQQVGENLHTHTRDLHVALQDRVQESATPRRLMPLWVTSAAASIGLVICVALYHFFYVLPKRQAPVAEPIEPGTVLIDAKTLGLDATTPRPASAPAIASTEPVTPRLATKPSSPRQSARPAPAQQPSAPHPLLTTITARPDDTEQNLIDSDVLPLPISQADIQRRQSVDTERAFER